MGFKQHLYNLLPNFLQSGLISIYNILEYQKRYGGVYRNYRKTFLGNSALTYEELRSIQEKRFLQFLNNAYKNSRFYKRLYDPITLPERLEDITMLPIISKEDLRSHINDVYTIKKGIKSKTGGTTGKSLEVLFTEPNMQERFAMLDDFRSRQGYKLGKKTAWFSGKHLLSDRDIKRKHFWKTDHIFNVRYYSTFHIKDSYLKHYIDDLCRFRPEFMVGFPSTMFEIAKYGLKNNIQFPGSCIKAIFTTAETITVESRSAIETFFKTKIYDQYASSEGAPFIFECSKGRMHLELQSGLFEILDDENMPTNSGRLIVTSFTTDGTPLIRYDIGDNIEVSSQKCDCGNNNPTVKQILGRIDDFVFSPENGKVNLGNVSNTLKDTQGIIKFQVVQNKLNNVEIKLVIDARVYTPLVEKIFLNNWADRLGRKMAITLSYVQEIPVEKSGKFRIVKNNIKHLITT